MSIIKDALQYLLITGQASVRPELLDYDHRRNVIVHPAAGGEPSKVEFVNLSHPIARHHMSDLGSLVELLVNEGNNAASAVYVDSTSVKAILDTEDPADDYADVILEMTQPFAMLHSTLAGCHHHHKAIRLLRKYYKDALVDGTLLPKMRTYKFRASTEFSSEVHPDSKALSRAVTKKVTGAADIPERFQIAAPLFDGIENLPVATCEVELILPMDDEEPLIEFHPIATSVRAAIAESIQWIRGDLIARLEQAGLETPVYLGVA